MVPRRTPRDKSGDPAWLRWIDETFADGVCALAILFGLCLIIICSPVLVPTLLAGLLVRGVKWLAKRD